MKYMGSKRAMLANGLGHLLDKEIPRSKRFVDLFTGSSVVARHAALKHDVSVLAFDLQQYSKVLASAVLSRTSPLDGDALAASWRTRAFEKLKMLGAVPELKRLTKVHVAALRDWSEDQSGTITRAYGGYYFSPLQAVWIDCLLATMPKRSEERAVALAAVVGAASQAAAAPGHTAQPFQPTLRAKPYLESAWRVDVVEKTMAAICSIARLHARKAGFAEVADANRAAKKLKHGDLVFIDPPYSGVHYSRFYHVLETVSKNSCGEVSGVGRYPPPDERPRSQYSVRGEAPEALDDLFASIAARGAKAIVTFPDHECSNGLSGEAIVDIAAEYFRIRVKEVDSKFSTMGGRVLPEGQTKGRGGRQYRSELILVLDPR